MNYKLFSFGCNEWAQNCVYISKCNTINKLKTQQWLHFVPKTKIPTYKISQAFFFISKTFSIASKCNGISRCVRMRTPGPKDSANYACISIFLEIPMMAHKKPKSHIAQHLKWTMACVFCIHRMKSPLEWFYRMRKAIHWFLFIHFVELWKWKVKMRNQSSQEAREAICCNKIHFVGFHQTNIRAMGMVLFRFIHCISLFGPYVKLYICSKQ